LQREYHINEQPQRAFRVDGNVHWVRSLKQLVDALYTTENNVHVYYKPNEYTPEQLVMKVEGFSFRRSSQGEHTKPEFDSFYKQDKKSERKPFRSIYEDDEEEYKSMELQNNEERHSRLSSFVSKYQTDKAYKHQLKVELEARCPRKTHRAEIELGGQCDQRLQHCKAIVKVQRTPIGEENDDWNLLAKIDTIAPENIRNEEDPEQKQSRMLVKTEAVWGQSSQQKKSTSASRPSRPARPTGALIPLTSGLAS